eukprot:CAMPEP_0194075816 /NCGR_PEP_ID=MMETSP0149-20130528/2743_1 /TAXON_ID=122233 /ORGANISM="Chaetoceros debilis, Strain MM31A-1" /LENGTH=663 /DNA_ID=CAMNT_0038756401 /DNA_START=84 /DNA_END=2072 /DNA_ORIENTATION=-
MKYTAQTVTALAAAFTLSALSSSSSSAFAPSIIFTRRQQRTQHHHNHSLDRKYPVNANYYLGTASASGSGSRLFATVEESSVSVSVSESGLLDEDILSRITNAAEESKQWADMFDLADESGAAFHALFSGIRSSANLGLKGKPFYLKSSDVLKAMAMGNGNDNEDSNPKDGFSGFFTFEDLKKALEDDFLDADRGSTDNRKGWKVAAVSTPRGSSFEDARMTLDEVQAALTKGTVIFNTAGSHIPKLAGATLACTDAAALPCALNMYVTAAGKRTSAPPHTDRQDVIVVQTQGKKHWKVYSPPDPAMKPEADMYARGKGDDNLPMYSLEEGQYGCKKLLDVTLEEGDVLFIPAAFPHTTDTIFDDVEDIPENTSIHTTFNFDTYVWDLSYLSARRLALMRAGVADSCLGQDKVEDSQYVGKVNSLPKEIRDELMSNFPLDFLDDMKASEVGSIDAVTEELERISKLVDPETYAAVPSSIWKETVETLHKEGTDLFDIHRDMYLAAIEEGRERKKEEEETAHLSGEELARAKAMTPEKMQRLSLFRVQKFFEQITEVKKNIVVWAQVNALSEGSTAGDLPDNWEFTLPIKVGDQVEADLGGAFFPAEITKVAGSSYDVKFFDGDVMNGLDRSMVKLLAPPASDSAGGNEDSPPPGLTKKELKRW